jgi:hypothetical protein
MGLYDQASKRVGGGGMYVKLESGKKVRLRILDLPRVSSRKFGSGDDAKTVSLGWFGTKRPARSGSSKRALAFFGRSVRLSRSTARKSRWGATW